MTIDRKSAEYIAQSLNCTQIHTPTTAKSSSPHSSSNDDPEHDEPGTGSNRDEENERRSRYSSCVPSAPLLRDEEEGGVDLPAAVQTLRMDGCGLRMAVLESLGEFDPGVAFSLQLVPIFLATIPSSHLRCQYICCIPEMQ